MRWFYLKDENKFPVACVASELDEDQVKFAVSTHNPLDPFNREMARKVAIGRLTHNKLVGKVPAVPGIKERIVSQIAMDEKLPTRTVKAANYWLEQRKTA